ncbi:hypothetical protein CHELA20_40434 [Hyphomicrobiales bacterium]|nr:hypothetical protein CHELA20_40434 [Hyphomicrobiales bacterium]CAH1688694.1 hypothetical protein CHELA41_40292 [Hyphomicrobiales bacterium]
MGQGAAAERVIVLKSASVGRREVPDILAHARPKLHLEVAFMDSEGRSPVCAQNALHRLLRRFSHPSINQKRATAT